MIARPYALIATTLLICGASAANAAVLIQTRTVTQAVNGTSSFNYARFNPSLGRLNSVTFEITSSVTVRASTPWLFGADINVSDLFADTAIVVGGRTTNSALRRRNFSVYVPGSANNQSVYTLTGPTTTFTVSGKGPVLDYVGNGTLNGTVSTSRLGIAYSAIFAQLNAVSNTVVRINYNYTPGIAQGVPEPATWAQLVLGFGLAGAVARQRRRRTIPGVTA